MKTLILILLFSSTLAAQVGKIVYLEGNVEVSIGTGWNVAAINTVLNPDQIIRTYTGSIAEIVWVSGAKTTVEPRSIYYVKTLFEGASKTAKTETASVFDGFMKAFKTETYVRRSEEGGIRRDRVELTDPNDVYWKDEREMSFEQASEQYILEDYANAVVSLQAFINQKPRDERVKYAIFAMGHSYVMLNNTAKAREVFYEFINRYYDDPMSKEVYKVLEKL